MIFSEDGYFSVSSRLFFFGPAVDVFDLLKVSVREVAQLDTVAIVYMSHVYLGLKTFSLPANPI